MNHIAHRDIEGRSSWAGRDQGGLAKLDHVLRNLSGACGPKLAQRIDASTLPQLGLNAIALTERSEIQKLALWGISSTKRRLIDRVQQDMDANLPYATQPPSNATH